MTQVHEPRTPGITTEDVKRMQEHMSRTMCRCTPLAIWTMRLSTFKRLNALDRKLRRERKKRNRVKARRMARKRARGSGAISRQ